MESSATPVKKKKGLGRLWNKVKLAFKSKSKTKPTASTTGLSDTQPTQTSTTQTQSQAVPPSPPVTSMDEASTVEPGRSIQPATETIEPAAVSSISPVTRMDEKIDVESVDQPIEESNTQPPADVVMSPSEKEELARRYERAQAIFKKYNIDLNEAGWDVRPKQQVERVHKPTRMRVRWTCHECKTTFGHDRICVECAHQRCKTCVRYPPKKRKAREAKKAALTAPGAEPLTTEVHDGACHECQTAFELGSQECSNCHHRICQRCLQESLVSAEQSETQPAVVA